MFAKIKDALSRLAGGGGGAEAPPPQPAVEYKGYRIRPAPYKAAGGQYQTAGVIEKDFPEGMKEHRFIRADTYASLDDANEFAISKAKQIIDQEGDRVFA